MAALLDFETSQEPSSIAAKQTVDKAHLFHNPYLPVMFILLSIGERLILFQIALLIYII